MLKPPYRKTPEADSASKQPNYVYRYRSFEKVLGNDELGKQTIYFADKHELNDPMEGFNDVFWNGDVIAWNNLLKHYLICLERAFAQFYISGGGEKIGSDHIHVFATLNHSPTLQHQSLLKLVLKEFLNTPMVTTVRDAFIRRETDLRRDELSFFLTCVHPYAIIAIQKAYSKAKLCDPAVAREIIKKAKLLIMSEINFSEIFDALNKNNAKNPFKVEEVMGIYKNVTLFGSIAQNCENGVELPPDNGRMLFVGFSDAYIQRLEDLIFPKPYVACFSARSDNATMWAHYGDAHKGLCFRYKTHHRNGETFLPLTTIIGCGGDKHGTRECFGKQSFQLHPVQYNNKYPEIDFFSTLGRLPVPSMNWWLCDDNHNASKCMDALSDEKLWRKKYWDTFINVATRKLKDWQYEDEFRLILNSEITDLTIREKRVLKFDFCDLDGIIFGIKTSEDHKKHCYQKVLDVCKELDCESPMFYQAYYSREKEGIQFYELGNHQR